MGVVPRSSEFLLRQKLALKSVHGRTLLRESLKAGLRMLGGFFFFSDKKKKSPITPKRKMTGKEGAYPIYPLYNHPSKKNVVVCKTNLSVFLTNFSLSATPFQNAHGWAWFHAAASFCSGKNSCSRMYKDVHP